MVYADFVFYKTEYGGKLISDEKVFDRLVKQAGYLIDELTFNRIKEPIEEVKMAACAVAEISYREYKQENEDQIVSETVGPHSVSYAKKNKTTEEYAKEKIKLIRMYLANTGLLYRGLASWNF